MRLLYLSKEIWTTDYGVEEGQVKLVAVWIPNPEMYLNFSIEYVSNLAPPPQLSTMIFPINMSLLSLPF